MTDDTAFKIAALVRELGSLRDECRVMPSDAQGLLIARTCALVEARKALLLVIAVIVEASLEAPAAALLDTTVELAKMLALLHRDASTRTVTKGEVLRLVADHADKTDAIEGKALDTLKALLKAPQPASSKPGSN